MKLPSSLSALETPVRDLVQEQIKRGKITLCVSQETAGKKPETLQVDRQMARIYTAAARQLKKEMKLTGEMTVSDLLRLPGILTTEAREQSAEKLWPSLKKTLAQGIAKAIQAKQAEGKKLAKDIHERLGMIAKAVDRTEKQAAGRSEIIYKKLKERLDQLLEEREKDADRLHREVAFLAERSDITEELVRLRSHLQLFDEKLKSHGESGRELDFICQEMNREINTISSKSQQFEIATEVILVKGELEKIREQIQNIE